METYVVTGGTGALGHAVCASLLREGHALVVPYRSESEAARFRADFAESEARWTLIATDLGDEDQVAALFKDASKSTPVAGLVHLAGGFAMAPIEETTLADFDGQLSVNLRTTFLCVREAVRHMKPAKRGRIVCVGSRAAAEFPGGMAAYVASKAAVVALVRSLANELHATGVSIGAVLPGTMDTPANRASMPQADQSKWTPTGTIAEVIRFLTTDAGGIANGAIIPVYGDS